MLDNNFKTIIKAAQPQLKIMISKWLKKSGYEPMLEDGFVYAKGNMPVMLIAHMDTVHHNSVTDICESENGIVMSPQGIGGDDRCGVYMITRIVNKLGNKKPYILFTEDEEIGGIGASKFVASEYIKKLHLNYMIELDRKGDNDAVYYSCGNSEFETFISSFGFKTAIGSFSDISVIAPEVGVAAVNLSSGYYDAHTRYETINLNDVENIISRVTDIINTETVKYKYIAKYNYGYTNYYSTKSKYKDWYNDYDYAYTYTPQTARYVMPIDFNLGYFINFNGSYIIEGDYYIDYDLSVYSKTASGDIKQLKNATAYNSDGSVLRYRAANSVYKKIVK